MTDLLQTSSFSFLESYYLGAEYCINDLCNMYIYDLKGKKLTAASNYLCFCEGRWFLYFMAVIIPAHTDSALVGRRQSLCKFYCLIRATIFHSGE